MRGTRKRESIDPEVPRRRVEGCTGVAGTVWLSQHPRQRARRRWLAPFPRSRHPDSSSLGRGEPDTTRSAILFNLCDWFFFLYSWVRKGRWVTTFKPSLQNIKWTLHRVASTQWRRTDCQSLAKYGKCCIKYRLDIAMTLTQTKIHGLPVPKPDLLARLSQEQWKNKTTQIFAPGKSQYICRSDRLSPSCWTRPHMAERIWKQVFLRWQILNCLHLQRSLQHLGVIPTGEEKANI